MVMFPRLKETDRHLRYGIMNGKNEDKNPFKNSAATTRFIHAKLNSWCDFVGQLSVFAKKGFH